MRSPPLLLLLLLLLATAAAAVVAAAEGDVDDAAAPVTTTVAVLGLGAMGCAAATVVARNKTTRVRGWNRTPERCTGVAGVSRATTIAHAVDGADVVLMAFRGMDVVRDVLRAEAAALSAAPSPVVVVLVSGSLVDARTLEDTVARANEHAPLHVLAGVALCAPAQVAAGGCASLVGGDPALYARAASVLGLIGRVTHAGSTLRAPLVYHTAIMAPIGALVQSLLHGMAMTDRAGFDPDVVAAVLGMVDMKSFVGELLDVVKSRRYAEAGVKDTSIATWATFNEHARDTCLALAMPDCGLYEWTHQLFGGIIAQGRGGWHATATYEQHRHSEL